MTATLNVSRDLVGVDGCNGNNKHILRFSFVLFHLPGLLRIPYFVSTPTSPFSTVTCSLPFLSKFRRTLYNHYGLPPKSTG